MDPPKRQYSRVALGTWIVSLVLLVILLLTVIALLVLILWLPAVSYRDLHGRELYFTELGEEVRISKDENGVIHVKAKSDVGAAFGQGYISAYMRLWQMEFMRRVGRGTLSEVAGEAALDVDREMRTLGLYRAAQEATEKLRRNFPQDFAVFEAFVNGATVPL
jgi:penicillin amidase